MASLPLSSFTTTQHHENQPIRTNPESTERVPSVPFHNVCAAVSPVDDRMSRLVRDWILLAISFRK